MVAAVHIPAWAVPSRWAVQDVIGMSVNAGDHPRAKGIIAALELASTAPDREAAASEATRVHMHADGDAHAEGRAATLYWLTGIQTQPPVAIPRRNDDGSLPTVAQLVDEAIAAEPYKSWYPEDRAAARTRAERQVAEWRRLAELTAQPQPSGSQ